MYSYNFFTKEIKHTFDNIKYVVNNSSLPLSCDPDEATVVKLFENLHVAVPVQKLGKLTIGGWNSETTGYFVIGYNKIFFSIHNDILYLRKRS